MSNATVECLDAAFKSDPNAIHALMVNRVPCNRELADHATIQVDQTLVFSEKQFQVGALGILNGVLAACGMPLVATKWSEPDAEGRRLCLGFCEYVVPISETNQRQANTEHGIER